MSHPYRISTITATGSVNTEINLDLFYDVLEVCDCDDEEGVTYVEYGKKKSETVSKGFCKKKAKTNKRKKGNPKKRFDNQVTIIYRKREIDGFNLLNIKVFKNGNVQMTGVKYIDQGRQMIDRLIGIMQTMDRSVLTHWDLMSNERYQIRLINSDFKIGFGINRRAFHLLCSQELEHDTSYEPCIYPGVMIQYFYNTTNSLKDGLCRCSRHCYIGKGKGYDDRDCKKVTISVFQSGSIIITGAHNHTQIDEVYEFISSFVIAHRDQIEKKKMVIEKPKKERKVVYIRKSAIRHL